MVSEVDPICALQAAMEAMKSSRWKRPRPPDIFVTATATRHHHHRAYARDEGPRQSSATSPFRQRDPDRGLKNLRWTNVKPQVDEIEFPDKHRIILRRKAVW